MNLQKRLKKFLFRRTYKKFLLGLYLLGLLLGILLTFVWAFVPSLTTCSSIFGETFCTPTGIFLILFLSLPGYLTAGNLLSILPQIPWGLSLLVVIIFSALFYFLLGLLIDKQKVRRLTTSSITKLIIYFVFFILIFFLVSLL